MAERRLGRGRIAVDSSVLVAAFASWHESHDAACAALEPALSSKEGVVQPSGVLVETDSVLTRRRHRTASRGLGLIPRHGRALSWRVAVGTLGLSLVLGPHVLAQDVGRPDAPPPEAPRVRGSVELSILEVDVRVTDRDGKPIRGLLASDFEVRVEKKPTAIENFLEYGGTTEAAAPGGAEVVATPSVSPPTPRRQKRYVVLFVDRISLPQPDQREQLFSSLRSLLRACLEDDGEVMAVTWERSVRTVFPFTSDPGVVERLLAPMARRSARPVFEHGELDQLERDAAWFRSIDPQSTVPGTSARFLAEQALAEMKGKASALRALVSTLGGLEGQKLLLLVSHRFSRYAGLEFVGDSASARSRFDAKRLVDSVAEAANANGVTLYAMYPAGLEIGLRSVVGKASEGGGFAGGPLGTASRAVAANEREALETLAERTGGLVAMGTVEAERMVPALLQDLGTYYSLGVAAPGGKADRTLAIEVRVRGRKDVTVRGRRDLVARSETERMKDRVLANLFGDVGSAPWFPIRVAHRSPRRVDGRYLTGIEVQVPIGKLVTRPSVRGEPASFTVYVVSAAPDGTFSEVRQATHRLDISHADLARARLSYFTYELEIETNGPESRLSVGVLDDLGKGSGFARLSLETAGR